MVRSTGVLFAGLFAAVLSSLAAPAAAEYPIAEKQPGSLSAGGVGLLFLGGMVQSDLELGAGPGTELPDPLRDVGLRLAGSGYAIGGGIRTSYQGDAGWRIGAAFSGLHLGGLDVAHGALPEGVGVRLDRAAAVDIDTFFGWGFDGGFMFPYIDAVASFDVVSATVAVDVDGFGHVGDSELLGFAFGVQPRVGAFIPLDGDWYVDTGIHFPVYGLETFGGYLALGTWDNY